MSAAKSPGEKIQAPNFLDIFESSLVRRHVGIIEFAETLCNKPLYPRQRTLLKILFLEELDGYDEDVLNDWIRSSAEGGEVLICPNVRDRMSYLREHGFEHFRQIVLVGGRRSSKGHITGLALAKKIYDQVLLDNVGKFYGIDQDKDIYFNIVAQNEDEAKANQFTDVVNWLLECKPLTDQGLINKILAERISIYTPYDKQRVMKIEAQHGEVGRDMAKLKVKAHGTNSRSLRGQATMALVLDEMAHLLSGESRLSDAEVYKAATPALMQFKQHALIFANSSPYTKVGKFFELYTQALALDPPEIGLPIFPDMFMLQFPSWELYRDWENDPIHKWAGAIMVDPKYDPILAQEEAANPEAFKVEYRGRFAEVVDAFLNPDMVDRMFDPQFAKEKLGRFLATSWTAQAFTVYKGHGDPSSTEANFGLAVAHVEEVSNAEGIPEQHVVFDLVHAFYPEDFEQHTIDWMEVIPVIEDLINNFRPYEFTFDQFQSNAPIQKMQQDLAARGVFETQVYTKTATAGNNYRRAMNFKAALNLGRVHVPHPTYPHDQSNRRSLELLRQELKFLQEKNGRVDKQDIGPVRTKDIADCLFECVDSLVGDSLSNVSMGETKMAAGGFQGYSIGGRNSGGDDPFSDYYAMKQSPRYPDISRGGRFTRQRGRPRW